MAVSLTGREAVRCRTNVPLDVELTFFVQVNRTAEDVLLVARQVGCERASDPDKFAELFHDRFASAVHEAFADVSFEDALAKREMVRDRIMAILGADLNGFVLEDVATPRLAPTPAEMLDPNDIRDAEAIRLITERTAAAGVATNDALADRTGGPCRKGWHFDPPWYSPSPLPSPSLDAPDRPACPDSASGELSRVVRFDARAS